MKLLYILFMLVTFFLAGCSILSKITAPQNATASKLVIQIATMKAIEAKGNPKARAQKIIEMADYANSLITADSSTTMDIVANGIKSKLDFSSMTLSDQLIATDLIDAVKHQIEKQVSAGALSPSQVVELKTVIGWIKETASLYVTSGA